MQNLKEATEGQDSVEWEREFQRWEAKGTKELSEVEEQKKGIWTFKGSKWLENHWKKSQIYFFV